ncbi:MAG: hypothetical protein HY300_07630 [Verrucomicrobia bacterium]|nr:hypothetical protein [Verrucomicrobiota bacterium]
MNSSAFIRAISAAALALVFITTQSIAGELSTTVTKKEPPAALDASIRKLLSPQAVQVLEDGKPVLEFWFCSEVAASAKPESVAKALDALKPVTLAGAVAVSGKQQRTYRDTDLAEGVYTMRFSLQPQDGDHLGSADYPYFLALIPAKLDTKPDSFANYTAMVKASGKETSSGHPIVFSLRPTSDGEAPKLLEPAAEHKSVRVKLNAKPAGGDATVPLVFEIVVKGKAKG